MSFPTLRPRSWFLTSLLLFAAAAFFWWLGNEHAARRAAERPGSSLSRPDLTLQSIAATRRPASLLPATGAAGTQSGPASSSLAVTEVAREAQALALQLYPHRLRNTRKSLDELTRTDTALLLRNAFIDTADPTPLPVPEHLRAPADPGGYIVQARGAIDERFRAVLRGQGAQIVSYFPNNAYLVRLSADGARVLQADERVQAVVPYEPYLKLDPKLLALAVEQQPLPPDRWINLTVFPGARDEALTALANLDAQVVAEQRTPFGPQLTVRPTADSLIALARLPSIQGLEPFYPRALLNDLTRVRVGVAAPAVTTTNGTNYLNLTGTNVLVNVNDTGVDAAHPDLQGRVLAADPASLIDTNGHGTHVAGVIISSGQNSPAGTNAPGSILGATYRGMAPGAKVFALPVDLAIGPLLGDVYLQETAARTNVLISNNSWNYPGAAEYNTAAASFDAAARDALPETPGAQPLLFVFGAGNDGFGRPDGLGGEPGRIESPATAKNVITVGALDSPRNITNDVTIDRGGQTVTNKVFLGETDSLDQVAPFSSRGNVGLGQEGVFGRFKPDVVAPGAFIVSTRSKDEVEDPLGRQRLISVVRDQVVEPGFPNNYHYFVPDNAVSLTLAVVPNVRSPSPMPGLPIFAKFDDFPTPADLLGTNLVTIASPTPGDWFYSIGNDTLRPVNFDLVTTLLTEVRSTDAGAVLKTLNDPLKPHYRFASGTSASAPAVSGLLALFQEFFEQRLQRTNSPALMKALLINGARSVAPFYDLNPRALLNYQGWGQVNLQNSLPATLTNADETVWPMRLFDQSPTNALATGQSRSWALALSVDAQNAPLRVTLVWTDPPGNPNAALKLVNDLDLVVSNSVSGQVFYGNNFAAGADFVQGLAADQPAAFDNVNNVENVFIREPLDTNYVVTVVGRRVNVNAVTAHTNDVVQDFALVIASTVTNAFIELTPQVNPLELRSVTALTNGIVLLNQRVGANPSMGPLPEGNLRQWTFYVFTNNFDSNASPYLTNGSNVAFVTFLPPQIARPRESLEADVDLYVSTNRSLLNLDPAVLRDAPKSTKRGGTELVVFTNAAVGPDSVFYLGVKSEDQQGGEYALVGLSTISPFEQTNGSSLILTAPQVFVGVPDGSPNLPGGANVLAIGITPAMIQRIVVTNTVAHENFGDLLGNLDHNNQFTVLNNHRVEPPPIPPDVMRTNVYVWDDSGQGDLFGVQPTDGPGSLRNFIGEDSAGVWLLTMVDNALTHVGSVVNLVLRIDPDLTGGDLLSREGGIEATVEPARFAYFPILVPTDATELHVFLTDMRPALPLELYLRRDQVPDRTTSDKFATISPPGGQLSLTVNDVPPLNPGRYWAGVYNPNGVGVTFIIRATIARDPTRARWQEFFSPDTPATILDDALSSSTIRVNIDRPIGDVRVGVRLDHPRASDLSLHLVSPQGSRFLLAENRGLHLADRYGGGELPDVAYTVFTDDTNLTRLPIKYAPIPFTPAPNPVPLLFSGFETVAPGDYVQDDVIEGWLVETNSVTVGTGQTQANTGTNFLALANASVSRLLPTLPGKEYRLRFAYRTGARGLFATGVDDSGVPLPGGSEDPHYQLVQSADGTYRGPAAFAVRTNSFPSFWETNSLESQWIAPRPDAGRGVASGRYVYRTGFDLGPFDPLTARIQGRLMVDYSLLDVLLNGTSTGLRYIGSGHFSRDFILQSGFRPGFNTLDFIVNNAASASGLRTELSLSARPLVTTNVPAPQVRLEGILTNDILGESRWLTNSFTFLARSNETRLTFAGGFHQVRLDTIQINEVADTWFLPEESLRLLIGESAQGDWRLELWDSRVGPLGLRPAELLSWRLQLRLSNTNAAAITLTNGLCYNGLVASNEIRYFIVNVPTTAAVANNFLSGSGDLVLLFNQYGLPNGQSPGDFRVDNAGAGGSERLILTTNGAPALIPGQRYYLGVTTPRGQSASDFQICVNFGPLLNVIALTNAIPYTNSIPATNQLDYYQFVVSPTAYQVSFDLFPQNGDLSLFVSKSRPVPDPLPTPTSFDYASRNLGVAPEGVVVRTDSSPVPLEPGIWYLGVQNLETNRVDYTIVATELTNAVNLIRLTEGVPVNFRMPPGRPITNYFIFTIDQTNRLAQFDVYNLSGQGDLLVQTDQLPTESVFLVKDPGAPNAPARIRLRTETTLPVLNGDWYLTVANQEPGDLDFTILATLPPDLSGIVTLTNNVAHTNTVPFTFPPTASLETDYYRFEVSTNALRADFEVIPVNGNVDLAVRRELPLPTSLAADYWSLNGGATNEFLRLTELTAPVPLGPGTWYLGVFNSDRHSVTYSVRATEYVPVVIELTHGVPYTHTIGTNQLLDYYLFNVQPGATRVLFELLPPGGPLRMFVRDALPLPQQGNAQYNTPAGGRQITFTTTTFPNPLHPGPYYLGVTNLSGAPVTYTIRATQTPAPVALRIDPLLVLTNNTLCLTWSSRIGTAYHVEGKANLTDPVWTAVSETIAAVAVNTTYCLPLPTPFSFFRVVVGPGLPPPLPEVAVTASDPDASEAGAEPGRFTFTRTGSTALPLTIRFDVAGSATEGADYAPVGRSLVIPTGASGFDLPILVATDSRVEGDETVRLTLLADAAYQLGAPTEATVTIHDAAIPPQPIVINPALVVTNNSLCLTFTSQIGTNYLVQGKSSLLDPAWTNVPGASATATSATTTLCLPLPTPFTFFRVVVGEGAPPPPPPPIVINPSLLVTNDSLCLTFTSGVGARYFVEGKAGLLDPAWTEVPGTRVTASSMNTTICIGLPTPYSFFRVVGEAGPPRPVVTVNAADATGSEAGDDLASFTVTRTGPTAGPLDVRFTLGGSAVNGVDFDNLGQTATIPAGAASVDIVVRPKPDADAEGDETVALGLAPDAAYSVGSPDRATVTIRDATPPVPVVIDPTSISLTPTALCFTLASQIGVTYFVQGKTNVTDAVWTEVPDTRVTATRPNTTVCIKLPTGFQFFRVVGEAAPPPPVEVRLDPRVTFTPTEVCLTWSSVAGATYQVQGKVELPDPVWTAIKPDVTASGPATTQCVPLVLGYHFFRVQQMAAGGP
jgi:subtilisin family serine protease/subtilisin-like proprotein convertase family protein